MRAEPVGSNLAPPPSDDPGEPALVEAIAAEIEATGPVTFARFMERALYEPGLGYYATSAERMTRAGDFVTAPELHPIFGAVVARQIEEMRQRLGAPANFTMREYGAGRRTLGSALPPDMRYEPIEFGDARPTQPFTGVVLANEFLDALPVHRVVGRDDGLKELRVGRSDGQFVEIEADLSDHRLAGWFQQRHIRLQPGNVADVNIAMLEWLAEIGRDLERGYALILDYGKPDAALYDPETPTSTLRAFRGQHVSSDVFGAVGHQDLTAHIDLDALGLGTKHAGLEFLGRVSQAEFLLNAGLDEAYAAARVAADQDWDSAIALRTAVRRLLDSSGLGGFQVAILGKGVAADPPLSGLVKRAL
jgi:SAM-dependent MidA family methyltransferase